MEILDSLEIRWFAKKDGSLEAAQSWFKPTHLEGHRVDHYLVTGRDDLGFKARLAEDNPAKLEMKYLLGSPGLVQLAPGIAGRLERWRKLSMKLNDDHLREQGTWIAMEKKRRLRRFVVEDGKVSELSGSTRVSAGCGVELTELKYQVPGEPNPRVAWTLGFEAFGPEAKLLDTLQSTLHAALGRGLPLDVSGQSSKGYPEWLRAELEQSPIPHAPSEHSPTHILPLDPTPLDRGEAH